MADAFTGGDKEVFTKACPNQETRSEMCVPIRLQGQVVWILNIEDKRPHAFKEPDREAIERLMGELEASLERALGAAILDEVLDAVPDAVVITDLAGRILRCNLSAREMLGGKPGQQMLASFFPEDPGCAAAVVQQTSVPVKRASWSAATGPGRACWSAHGCRPCSTTVGWSSCRTPTG